VLTARLQKLTDTGSSNAAPTPSTHPRYEYHPTEKGRALFPVMTALLAWGDQWAPTPGGPPVVLVHDTCGNITAPVLTCPHCHAEVSAATPTASPAWEATSPPLRVQASEGRVPRSGIYPSIAPCGVPVQRTRQQCSCDVQ